MRRRLLLLSAIACVALVLPSLTAANNGNKPDRRITLDQGDGMIDSCGFPVFVHIEGREIDTDFTVRDRTVARLLGVFPGNTWTLTNLDTGTSISLGSTSSFHQQTEPDGSYSVKVVGEGVWPFENPLTGEPGIWHQRGQVSGVFESDGSPISTKGTGSLVNLCRQLGI